MRLIHSSAMRGLAVATAGAALFASAMLGSVQVANASVGDPVTPDQTSTVYQANDQATGQAPDADAPGADAGVAPDAGTAPDADAAPNADAGSDADAEQGDAGEYGDHHDGDHHDGDHHDGDHHDGDHHGKHGKHDGDHHGKHHGKQHCDHHGMGRPDADHGDHGDHGNGQDSTDAQDFGQHGSDNADHDSGRPWHCHMPHGGVESGRGGAAVAAEQSSVAPISLGALAVLMLGSGTWVLARVRRTAGRSVR